MTVAKSQATPAFNWRRTLYIIWFAEFISMAGMNTAIPFLPYYVKHLGVTSDAQIEIWTGFLYTGQAIAMAIMGPIWGSLADRYGRKMMVMRAMLGGAIIIGLMGFVANVQQLFVLRTFQGAITGTVTACNILVAACTPETSIAFALGTLETAVFLGQSAGPIIGGFVADALGYRACFFVTAVLCAIAGVLVWLYVSEARIKASEAKERPSFATGMRMVFTSSLILSLFAIRLFVRSGFRATAPTLPLLVADLVPNSDRAASIAGLVTSAFTAASAIGAMLIGRIGDRVGIEPVLMASTALMSGAYLVSSGAQNVWQLGLSQALGGLGMGGALTTLYASMARHAPPGFQGAVFGLDTTMNALANAIGPMMGSLVAVQWGERSSFRAAGLAVALATVLMLVQRARGNAIGKSVASASDAR